MKKCLLIVFLLSVSKISTCFFSNRFRLCLEQSLRKDLTIHAEFSNSITPKASPKNNKNKRDSKENWINYLLTKQYRLFRAMRILV
jgi:hypothetical protein